MPEHAEACIQDRAIWTAMTERGRTLVLAVLVVTTLVSALGAASHVAGSSSLCQDLAVPAYFRPGGHWDRATSGSPSARYLVMNPASGPGSARDESYEVAVRNARGADAKVLGYVPTDYGRRDPALVEAEVDRYREWYDVDGIFFDEVTSGRSGLPYYRRLVAHVRTVPDALVALNPGTYPDRSYTSLGDLIVTFEGTFEAYRGLDPPSWTEEYPPAHFWHLVHTTHERDMSSALGLARSHRVGSVYVTEDTLDNPWDGLPSYWPAEQRAVAESTPRSCPAS